MDVRLTRRIADSSAEREVAKFLDYFLYARLARPPFDIESQRTDTAHAQLAGSDVVLHSKSRTYIIDEKAQIYYINRSLPTFAFEIDSLQNGILRPGWFLNTSLTTSHYLLVWPYAHHAEPAVLKMNDITKLECLCIDKLKLQRLLTAGGWNTQRIQAYAQEIRSKKMYGATKIGSSTHYFFQSLPQQYREAPVNVIVYRHVLESLAEFRVTVYPSYLEFR